MVPGESSPSPARDEPMNRSAFALAVALFVAAPLGAQDALRDDAATALKKATNYYHAKLAKHGGYVYYTSDDLKQRWGEGKADDATIFVQPPATPTVGLAFLRAYEAAGDPAALDAARDAAEALVSGQLKSGGWTQTIHFGPAQRLGMYRNGKGGNWNASSLDDGQTQAALQFLAQLDVALKFQHAAIHEAAIYGYDALLKAQFLNGAFPQIWRGPVEPQPALKAKFPDYDWKTEGRVKNYWDYYTLNDGLAGSVYKTPAIAHKIYGEEKYQVAIEKLGDFLIAAQMPDPQPGWCQQYNYKMVPIWARKFEPSAITASEGQDVLETLIAIARSTGKAKYLEPVPRALEYYKTCVLPDGKVARYYEFKTNKPLYMDAAYQLTYDDKSAPTHYGWKQPAHFGEIEKEYEDAKSNAPPPKPRSAKSLEAAVRKIVADLDAEYRWVSVYAGESLVGQPKFAAGFRYLSSGVFSRNVETLSEYFVASKP